MMAASLHLTGALAQSRKHCDEALTLYNPVEHRSLVMRFGSDHRTDTLSIRAQALWLLGYPKGGLTDAEDALSCARATGHAPKSALSGRTSIDRLGPL
jgi:hypothetical protein